jgi:hypothetical protein
MLIICVYISERGPVRSSEDLKKRCVGENCQKWSEICTVQEVDEKAVREMNKGGRNLLKCCLKYEVKGEKPWSRF